MSLCGDSTVGVKLLLNWKVDVSRFQCSNNLGLPYSLSLDRAKILQGLS